MKTNQRSLLSSLLAVSALHLAVISSPASQVLINAFNTSDEVNNNNGNPWGNWFGQAYYQVVWSPNDAQGNANSGSMYIQSIYPDAGIGGCCGPQFVVYNQNNGINPPLAGNGAGGVVATNVEFDVKFDPSTTITDGNGNWPTIEVGTRGTGYGQPDFGTFTIPTSQTGWVHVNIPINVNPVWATIPNIFFKFYSSSAGGSINMYIDNIAFDMGSLSVPPPTMAIQKPTNALRVFAGSTANTYDREQLTSIDQNQSWVGGTYPVSYSYTLKSFPAVPTGSTFRFHIFLVPVAAAGGNSFTGNQYIEYNAGNNLWLNVSGTNPTNVVADISWKTNLPNANPNQTALTITNSTAIGIWTLTFNSASTGTLTAPGASPVAFTIADANVATDFANPLVAFFGVQPDSTWGQGQYADVANIRTVGVASPGVAINADFTTATGIDTNIWDTSNSALPTSLVVVPNGSAWWVNWTYPDTGFTLETGTNVAATDASGYWSTPAYYTGYNTNALWQNKMGQNVWSLIPQTGLPTTNGTSNGVPSGIGFFRLTTNTPAR